VHVEPLCAQTQFVGLGACETDLYERFAAKNSTTFIEVTKMASSDIQEIKALNAKYNFSLDESNAEAWASCFTADGAFNASIDGAKPKGTEQLEAFVPTCTATYGTMYHLTTNEIISVDGEHARQKCYLQFFTKKNGTLEGYICVYDDWHKRENGVWKYSRRNVATKDRFTHLED
jgi:ketosteroid isomerase-like protein